MHKYDYNGRELTVELAGKSGSKGKGKGGGDRGGSSYHRNDSGPASSDDATCNLFVANIPQALSDDDVRAHFEKYVQLSVSCPCCILREGLSGTERSQW